MGQPYLDQENFRVGDDNGSESAHGWLGTLGQDLNAGPSQTITDGDQIFLRFTIANTGAKVQSAFTPAVEIAYNGGSYANVGSTGAFKYATNATYLTDGEDTTDRLGGTGTFDTTNSGVIENDYQGASNDITNGYRIEVLIVLEFDQSQAVANGDYYDIRVAGLDNWTDIPRFTIANLPTATINQRSFRIRSDDSVGLNTDSGWAGAAGVDANMARGKTFRIAFEIDETAGATKNQAYELRYQKNGAGGYSAVQGVPYSSATAYPIVWGYASGQYAHGDSITSNLVNQSAKTFTNGHGVEDTTGDVESNSVSLNNQATVLEFTIRIPSIYDGPNFNNGTDYFDFRLYTSAGVALDSYVDTPRITLIDDGHIGGCGIENPDQFLFCDSNGNLYHVLEVTEVDNEILMLKSTDGGDSWDEVDGAGRPGNTDLEAGGGMLVGDVLHIGIQEGATVYYKAFNVSSHGTPDDWAIDENVDTGATGETDQSGSIAVTSGGTPYIFFRDSDGSNQTIYWRKRTGTATYSARDELDTEASTEFVGIKTIIDNNGKIHCFYADDTNNDVNHRTIDTASSDSKGTVHTVYTDKYNGGSGQQEAMTNPVYWVSGSDHKVMIGVLDHSDNYLYTVIITNDGTPASAQLVASRTVSNDPGAFTSRCPVATLAVDEATDTIYCLLSDATTEDIYLYKNEDGAGWSEVQELKDGVNCDAIRALVFTHNATNGSKKVLGYIWDEGSAGYTGYARYDEYEIPVPVTVSLNTATITCAGQVLTVDAPSSVTVVFTTATITSAGQTLSVIAPNTVSLNTASLTSAGEVLSVISPNTVSLSTAVLTTSGEVLSVDAPITISLSTANILSAGESLSAEVDLSINLSTATLVSAGEILTVIVPNIIGLSTASISVAGQTISVFAPNIVNLLTGSITASGEILSVDTPITISLATATITVAGETISVIAPNSVNLSTANITTSGEILEVQIEVSVSLNTATITVAGETISVIAPQSINLLTANLTASGEILEVISPNTISLATATLTASGEVLAIQLEVSVSLNTATITVAGETISVIAPQSINLLTANLTATGEVLSVQRDLSINLATATLTATGETLIIGAQIFISLNTASTGIAGEVFTVISPNTITLSTAVLVSNGEAISVIAPIVVNFTTAGLVLSGETLVVGASISIPLDTAVLTISGQSVNISTPLTISLSTASISISGESIVIIALVIVTLNIADTSIYTLTVNTSNVYNLDVLDTSVYSLETTDG